MIRLLTLFTLGFGLFFSTAAARAGDSLPTPWNGMDIGAFTPAGAATAQNGQSFALSGGGTELTGAADQFHFVFQSATGDFSLVARLTVPAGEANAVRAGLMAREALATTSNFFAMSRMPGDRVERWFRVSPAPNAAFNDAAPAASPVWLRLVKWNGLVEGYVAPDNKGAPGKWLRVGFGGSSPGTGLIYVGLWSAGGGAAFDHVALSLGTPPAADNGTYAITPAGAPTMALTASGSGVGLTAFGFHPGQQWAFTRTSGSVYAIRPFGDPTRALSVAGGKADAGTAITLEPDKAQSSQRWSLASNPNGTLGLVPQCAPGDGLDDFGGIATSAARIDLWPRNESDPHLQWTLVPAP